MLLKISRRTCGVESGRSEEVTSSFEGPRVPHSGPESHVATQRGTSSGQGNQQTHTVPLWAWLDFPEPPSTSPFLPCLTFQQGPRETLFFPREKACGELSLLTVGFLGAAERWKRPLGPCCLITFGPSLIGGNLGPVFPFTACPAGRSTGCVVSSGFRCCCHCLVAS